MVFLGLLSSLAGSFYIFRAFSLVFFYLAVVVSVFVLFSISSGFFTSECFLWAFFHTHSCAQLLWFCSGQHFTPPHLKAQHIPHHTATVHISHHSTSTTIPHHTHIQHHSKFHTIVHILILHHTTTSDITTHCIIFHS